MRAPAGRFLPALSCFWCLIYRMNERAQQTERAALRLIKSQARKHVYTARVQAGSAAFERMLMLEEAIEEEATRDWQAIRRLWANSFDRLALLPLIAKVAIEAYRECRTSCEELGPGAMSSLKQYFEAFDPKGLLS